MIFGGGCFWCTEAVFRRIRGVVAVVPGYAGGTTPHPTYEDVVSGRTGHAEVVHVTYDPVCITIDDLLAVFFATHDPTTRHRQGNDVGPQYRSMVLATLPAQASAARAFIEALNREGGAPIVTEVAMLEAFTPAEPEHQRYYERNAERPYCQLVIDPKLRKLQERFQKLVQE